MLNANQELAFTKVLVYAMRTLCAKHRQSFFYFFLCESYWVLYQLIGIDTLSEFVLYSI